MGRIDLSQRRANGASSSTLKLMGEEDGKLEELAYHYNGLEEGEKIILQRATTTIKRLGKRVMEDVIEIGHQLNIAKGILPHGDYMEWARVEFGMGHNSITDYRYIADRFGGKFPIMGILNPTTARMLASPKVEEEVIEAVMEESQARGRPLMVKEVKEIKERLQPSPKAPKPTIHTTIITLPPSSSTLEHKEAPLVDDLRVGVIVGKGLEMEIEEEEPNQAPAPEFLEEEERQEFQALVGMLQGLEERLGGRGWSMGLMPSLINLRVKLEHLLEGNNVTNANVS